MIFGREDRAHAGERAELLKNSNRRSTSTL